MTPPAQPSGEQYGPPAPQAAGPDHVLHAAPPGVPQPPVESIIGQAPADPVGPGVGSGPAGADQPGGRVAPAGPAIPASAQPGEQRPAGVPPAGGQIAGPIPMPGPGPGRSTGAMMVPSQAPSVPMVIPRAAVVPYDPIKNIRSGQRFALAMLLLFGSVLCWASVCKVEMAVRADATIIPIGQNRRAQHLEGGVVREMLVHEGDTVAAGQILVQISPEQAGADLRERQAKMAALRASITRLTAEMRGADRLEVADSASEAERTEAAAFVAAHASLMSRVAATLEQARRSESDARAKRAQMAGLKVQEAAIARTVQMQRSALALGGGSAGRLAEAEAQMAGVHAQAAPLPDAIEADEAAAREAQARAAAEAETSRAEAAQKLAQANSELASLVQNAGSAADRLRRTEVRSPVRGVIQKLYVNDIGEVVPPNSTVADVVPVGDGLVVEARVRPEDMRGLRPGLRALVRISAYDEARYGVLYGEVVSLSPDAAKDERTGMPYYKVRIRTDTSEIGGEPVRIGMQANVSIITGERTILQYLTFPVTAWAKAALRER